MAIGGYPTALDGDSGQRTCIDAFLAAIPRSQPALVYPFACISSIFTSCVMISDLQEYRCRPGQEPDMSEIGGK